MRMSGVPRYVLTFHSPLEPFTELESHGLDGIGVFWTIEDVEPLVQSAFLFNSLSLGACQEYSYHWNKVGLYGLEFLNKKSLLGNTRVLGTVSLPLRKDQSDSSHVGHFREQPKPLTQLNCPYRQSFHDQSFISPEITI